MPEKVSKPKAKTKKEKEEDKKLLDDIADDPQNPGDQFDPLEAQADRLPSSIKGADGDKSHVLDINDGEPVHEQSGTSDEDEDLGGGIGDASKLTAD